MPSHGLVGFASRVAMAWAVYKWLAMLTKAVNNAEKRLAQAIRDPSHSNN